MLIAASLALLNACRGQGKPSKHEEIQRKLYLPKWLFLGCAAAITQDIAAMWVIVVLTCLPTNALMSCIHGDAPQREDHGEFKLFGKVLFKYSWQFLQEAAERITPKSWGYEAWGAVYGTLRASLALPAMIYNPWLLVMLSSGLIYYACGQICKEQKAVRVSEMVTGFMVGGCL